MADRMDVLAFRKLPSGKTMAIRCGSALPRKDGEGFNVYLDAIPAPVDGQYQLSIVPQRERQGSAPPADDVPWGN